MKIKSAKSRLIDLLECRRTGGHRWTMLNHYLHEPEGISSNSFCCPDTQRKARVKFTTIQKFNPSKTCPENEAFLILSALIIFWIFGESWPFSFFSGINVHLDLLPPVDHNEAVCWRAVLKVRGCRGWEALWGYFGQQKLRFAWGYKLWSDICQGQ